MTITYKNLSRRIARRYSKEAGIFKAPPALVHEVSSFMVKKYAGHILALTEKKIASVKGDTIVNYDKVLDLSQEAFRRLLSFIREKHTTNTSEDFMIRPDIQKSIRIQVELIIGRPYFSYVWVKKGKPSRGSNKLVPAFKMNEKVIKLHKKEWRAVQKLKRSQLGVQMQDQDTSLVELTLIRNKCLEYTSKAKSYKTTARTDLEIDLTGWSPVERSMGDAEQKVRDFIASLQGDKEKVGNLIEGLDQGENVEFTIDAYMGKGIAVKRMDPSTILNVRKGEEGSYVLGSPYDSLMKDTPYDDLEELIERVERYYEESISICEDTLETINWSSIYEKLSEEDLDTFTAVLDFKGHMKRGGQWLPSKRELQVDMPFNAISVKAFETNIQRILQVTRHECQHIGQDIIQILKGLRVDGGIPALSLRDESYTPTGYRSKGRSRKRKEHALRDNEFYTRIQDEVDRFIVRSRSIPQKFVRIATRIWVGDFTKEDLKEFNHEFNSHQEKWERVHTTDFFAKLKANEPEKWKKAVKEFISAISSKVAMD